MIHPAFTHCAPSQAATSTPVPREVAATPRSDLQHAVRACEDIVLSAAVDS